MWALLIILLSLAGLVAGSDWTVRGAKALAKRAGWSPMMIGLTVISIGTSLPEIGTNLAAGANLMRGLPASGIAVGNVVGSNLSQITLLLGLVALVAPLRWRTRSFRWDGTMVLAAAGVMWLVCVDGTASRWEGAALIAAYAAYLVSVWWRGDRETEPDDGDGPGVLAASMLIIVGLSAVGVSAHFCVEYGVAFARTLGVGEEVIGLWVGVGTGMPELAVSLRAVRSGDRSLSLGNLMGSNITDPLLSFGGGVCVHPMAVSDTVLRFDFPFWLAATGIALLLLRRKAGLDRLEATGLLALFAAFVALRWALF